MKTQLVCLLLLATPALAQSQTDPWPAEVEKALARAKDNRPELEKALKAAPADQRKGIVFLVSHMPDRDLRSLKSDFLLENLALAYKARAETAWGSKIPEAVFFNDVLPYANVDEERHPWRKELYELCMPLVKDCKTPSEVAQRLNEKVFPILKVRYSTGRKKAQQSPKESMETGLASCTGLSILLSDACRSVGVPARLVGTPLWTNKTGNHTWVEIWDGDWHFTGACEPDPKGLDRGWFVGNASQAKKDDPRHSIYAASFQKTDVAFPLVWAPGKKDVPAENVTDRYTKLAVAKVDQTKVLIRVWGPGQKLRLALPVTVTEKENPAKALKGESRGETNDRNDMLAFELPPGRDYVLRIGNPVRLEKAFKTMPAGSQQILDVEVPAQDKKEPGKKPKLSEAQLKELEDAALAYFKDRPVQQLLWEAKAEWDQWLAVDETAVRQAVWKAYKSAPIHEQMKKDFDGNTVRSKTGNAEHVSPYVLKKVGKRPENGWPLVIAMHGGGGVPKNVNDSQWKQMQIYYKDQPSVTGYQYLALRAPNDVWNGFYDQYVPPLVINLIRQSLLFGDVDPNKVYLIGYSHGGYGAFYIGPKIPDRFAAIHCSASAPTDGTISPLSLRNTRFTFMIGENDTAFGRRERCEKFNEVIGKLKEENKGEFPVEMEFKKGVGHGGLPDRDKIKELYPHTRSLTPRRLTWEPTDGVITDHFWVSVANPAKGQSIDATLRDGVIDIKTKNLKDFDLCLDGRLVAYDKAVQITVDGKTGTHRVRPDFVTLCRSILQRGDPEMAFTCRVHLELEK